MVIWTVGYQFNQRNIFQFGFFEFHLQCRQQYIKLAKLLFFAMNLNRLQILIGILGRCQCGSSHKGPEGNGNPKKRDLRCPWDSCEDAISEFLILLKIQKWKDTTDFVLRQRDHKQKKPLVHPDPQVQLVHHLLLVHPVPQVHLSNHLPQHLDHTALLVLVLRYVVVQKQSSFWFTLPRVWSN